MSDPNELLSGVAGWSLPPERRPVEVTFSVGPFSAGSNVPSFRVPPDHTKLVQVQQGDRSRWERGLWEKKKRIW